MESERQCVHRESEASGRKIVQSNPGISPADLEFFSKARYIRSSGTGTVGKRRAYAHNVLKVGYVVSAIVHPGPESVTSLGQVQTVSDGSGDCKFYAICHILRNAVNGDVWIFGKEMNNEGNGTLTYSCSGSDLVYMRLDVCCRRVAAVHKCTRECIRSNGWKQPVHDKSILQGGSYRLVSRSEGFPPFLG